MSLSKKSLFWRISLTTALLGALTGCATSRTTEGSKEKSEDPAAQVAELRNLVAALTSRIDGLEGNLSAMNAKLEKPALVPEPPKATPVLPHPSSGAGLPPAEKPVAADPQAGFVNDEAVQSYRRAMILLQGQKYSEAVLAFSNFLERFPDHPLAGSAQYYVGEAYFRQKEYKLALHEFRRVLTSYDRSPHLPATLHSMAEAEDALKMPEEAARHRQTLTSLFPQSPAANFELPPRRPQASAEPSSPQGLDEPPATAPLRQEKTE